MQKNLLNCTLSCTLFVYIVLFSMQKLKKKCIASLLYGHFTLNFQCKFTFTLHQSCAIFTGLTAVHWYSCGPKAPSHPSVRGITITHVPPPFESCERHCEQKNTFGCVIDGTRAISALVSN